jgi:hypothetical protein
MPPLTKLTGSADAPVRCRPACSFATLSANPVLTFVRSTLDCVQLAAALASALSQKNFRINLNKSADIRRGIIKHTVGGSCKLYHRVRLDISVPG